MKIMIICKYPPIQGGVSAEAYWTANAFAELGHSVFVLTNAEEVESSYRTELDENDKVLLTGFRRKDCIRLRSTTVDKRHVYVPQNNPSISKLVSIGLEVIEEFKPDFIYSFYVEPYGVAAMILSKMTGIPYTVRHAGSDIGRLMLTDQLKTLYRHVFTQARAVLSTERHYRMFQNLGVAKERFVRPVSLRLPGDVFHSEGRKSKLSVITIGMYGKVGKAKGTLQALQALNILRAEGVFVKFRAHWGGRDLPEYIKSISDLDLSPDFVVVRSFIPHWRIPVFIRECDIVLFLENNFKIAFHTPGIPFEVWSCGTHLVTTAEIATKLHIRDFVSDYNCTIIPNTITGKSVADAVRQAISKIDDGKNEGSDFDASLQSIISRQGICNALEQIKTIL